MLNSLRQRAPEPEQRVLQGWGPSAQWGGASPTPSGVVVNESSATQLLTVYGAVSLISDTIATLPHDVYRDAEGPAGVIKPGWLVRPNPRTSFVEFISQTLWSLLLDGNAYWAYGVDGNLLPSEVHVLDPEQVQVKPAERGNDVEYWVRGTRFTGRLLHIKGVCRPGDVKGVSPLEAARLSIGLGLSAQDFAARFYGNGATLSGTIETDADLTPEQAAQLQESWARAHSGLANAHKPGVLDNGATWKPASVTPEQAQFLQTRNFQSAEICGQMFLLDPTLLGIPLQSTSLTYANLEQRGIHLVQFTLLRWIVRLEKAITSLLPRSQYFKFTVAGLERADLKTRYEAHRIALGPNVPWETQAEVRSFEELPFIPGTDELPEQPEPVAPVVQQQEAEPEAKHFTIVMPEPTKPPIVNIDRIDVRADVAPADVTVNVPDQQAPIINVTPAQPEIRVDVQPTPFVVEGATVHNHVPAPEVNVTVEPTPIEVRNEVQPTDVHVDVAAPEVTFNAPDVQVEAPVVNMQPQFNVEAPNVNIRPQPIRIDAPQVHLPRAGKIRRTFERDENDSIIAIIEEPVEDGPDEGTSE